MVRYAHTAACRSESCKGCAPRAAAVGFVCWGCFDALAVELARWPKFAAAMRGVERPVKHDGGGATQVGYVPLTGVQLAIDECSRWLATRPDDDASWVSTLAGAEAAVRFTRASQAAHRAYPAEEPSRRLRRMHCPGCGMPTLLRVPPEGAKLPVQVVCQTEGCGRVIREGDTTPDILRDGTYERVVEKLDVIAEIEARRA